MRCPQCNAKIDKGMKYCPICGENISIYQQSQEKKKMEGEAYSYFDHNQRKKIDDQMAQQMVEPLSQDKRNEKKKTIVIATIALLAGFGGFYLLNYFNIVPSKSAIARQTQSARDETQVVIKNIRPEYYQQGIAFLDTLVCEDMHQRAIAIGGNAFLSEVDNHATQLDEYYQKAENDDEKTWGDTIESICLYSLGNDVETAFVQEMGGRNDEQQNVELDQRKEIVDDALGKIKNAKTIDEIVAIKAKFDE